MKGPNKLNANLKYNLTSRRDVKNNKSFNI